MNFAEKLNAGSFSQDISPLLAPNIKWDFEKAAIDIFERIIPLIPVNNGNPIKKIKSIISDEDTTSIPHVNH